MVDENDNGVVDFGQLIAGPLEAVVEADFHAAERAAEIIERFGFEHVLTQPASQPAVRRRGAEPPKALGRLAMVTFDVDRPGPDGEIRPLQVRVPKLSLIPLPLLQVHEANFDFGVRIFSAERSVPATGALRLPRRGDEPLPDEHVRWRAALARGGATNQTQQDLAPHVDANMQVKVQMRQSDLPNGITRLLAFMGDNFEVSQGASPLAAQPTALALSTGALEPSELTLTHGAPEGQGSRRVGIQLALPPAVAPALFFATRDGGELVPDAAGVRHTTTDALGRLELVVAVSDPKGLAGLSALELEVSAEDVARTRITVPIRITRPLDLWLDTVTLDGPASTAVDVITVTGPGGASLPEHPVRLAMAPRYASWLSIFGNGQHLEPDAAGLRTAATGADGRLRLSLRRSPHAPAGPLRVDVQTWIDGVLFTRPLEVLVSDAQPVNPEGGD